LTIALHHAADFVQRGVFTMIGIRTRGSSKIPEVLRLFQIEINYENVMMAVMEMKPFKSWKLKFDCVRGY